MDIFFGFLLFVILHFTVRPISNWLWNVTRACKIRSQGVRTVLKKVLFDFTMVFVSFCVISLYGFHFGLAYYLLAFGLMTLFSAIDLHFQSKEEEEEEANEVGEDDEDDNAPKE